MSATSKRVMNQLLREFGESHSVKCDLASEVLRTSGHLRLRVSGLSMLPAIWPGDTLEVERTKRDELSAGDVVLFSRDQRLFAHRILKTSDHGILTHGDAMPRPDPLVAENELLGRVAGIVRNGKLIQPNRTLSFSQRAIAGVARSSDFGARVVVGIHGFLQK